MHNGTFGVQTILKKRNSCGMKFLSKCTVFAVANWWHINIISRRYFWSGRKKRYCRFGGYQLLKHTNIRKFYPFFLNPSSSQCNWSLFKFLSIQVLLRVCSPDLLMSELDSIRAASLHAVPPHHDQRRVGVRRLALVQCFYCCSGQTSAIVRVPESMWAQA